MVEKMIRLSEDRRPARLGKSGSSGWDCGECRVVCYFAGKKERTIYGECFAALSLVLLFRNTGPSPS